MLSKSSLLSWHSGGTGGQSTPHAAEVETVNDAWKHVKAVMVHDAKSSDLYDLLAQSGKDTIDPMPSGVCLPPSKAQHSSILSLLQLSIWIESGCQANSLGSSTQPFCMASLGKHAFEV